MQQQTVENTTQGPITVVVRRETEGRTAIGSKEFAHTQLTFRPGINELSAEEAEALAHARKGGVTRERFDKGQLLLKERPLTRAMIVDRIQKTTDPDQLRRWRSETKDRQLLQIIEDQLAACTVTVDGEPTAGDVRRDPKDPKKAQL